MMAQAMQLLHGPREDPANLQECQRFSSSSTSYWNKNELNKQEVQTCRWLQRWRLADFGGGDCQDQRRAPARSVGESALRSSWKPSRRWHVADERPKNLLNDPAMDSPPDRWTSEQVTPMDFRGDRKTADAGDGLTPWTLNGDQLKAGQADKLNLSLRPGLVMNESGRSSLNLLQRSMRSSM